MKRRLKWRSIGILFLATLLALLCTYLTLAIHPEIMVWPGKPLAEPPLNP
ncbi:MAG TPA: hypothetical protein PKD72_02280 [Gemmatales bacterium]|nr:hypothetical protein [Gemmatales bacterium]